MYTIGYDIGSSSVKIALVEQKSGKKIDVIQEPKDEMGMISIKPSWAEQDPNMWWKLVCVGTKNIIKKNNISSKEIIGIGISYQMHGLVLVDSEGKSLRNSIIWCDSRAVPIGQKAFEELGEDRCMSHLLNSPANFTASKLKWVINNEPEIYEKVQNYMLPGDYIALKFSGEINSTINGLSEGILWDYKNLSPANWLMDYYGIDKSLTPNICENFKIQGKVCKKGSLESGLEIGTPIKYRAGDQPNNALSLNVFRPGEIAATGGTSGVVYALTSNNKSSEPQRINHFAHVNYSYENQILGKLLCINGAGILFRWLRNNTGANDYGTMNELAEKIAIGSNALCVLPFGNGAERMLDNKSVGSKIVNLDFNIHNDAAIYRAALEGIAFAFVYGINILEKDGCEVGVIRAGNDNLFRSKIFSNTISTLINQKIEIYDTTGAVGAARAALINDNDFGAFKDFLSKNDLVGNFEPKTDKTDYIEAFNNWKIELEKNLTQTT